MKTLQSVVRELRQVVLPQADDIFLGNVKMLLDEGLDDGVSEEAKKRILALHAKYIGPRVAKAAANQPVMPTPAQLQQMIAELDEAIIALSDKDRDYVQGVKLMLEMSEPITVSDVQKVSKIYMDWQKSMHKGLG